MPVALQRPVLLQDAHQLPRERPGIRIEVEPGRKLPQPRHLQQVLPLKRRGPRAPGDEVYQAAVLVTRQVYGGHRSSKPKQ